MKRISDAGERVMRLIPPKLNPFEQNNFINQLVIENLDVFLFKLFNTSMELIIDLSERNSHFENVKESYLARISEDNFNLNHGIDLYEFQPGFDPNKVLGHMATRLAGHCNDYGTPEFQFLPLKINSFLKDFLIYQKP